MPGKGPVKMDRSGKPPEPRTKRWTKICDQVQKLKGHGRPFCGLAGGKRRSDGWPCESPYIKKNGLCRIHGGNVRSGVNHPHFKHGRTSGVLASLPKRFKDAYMASLTDDDLLSLRSDIALSDARVNELLERLDTGENPRRWGQVALTSTAIISALAKTEPDLERVSQLAMDIDSLATAAAGDERNWRELRTQAQHRRTLVDSERARLKDMHAYVTAEEAVAIVSRLVDTVIRHVDDKAVLSAILHEVQQITGNDPAQMRRDAMRII